jgi:peptide/nickel transport system substrate-binding protein
MHILKISLIALIGLTIFSCKTDPKNVENIVNIRIKKDPERINPIVFPNPIAREIYQYLHVPLADFDPHTLEITPILIKNLPIEMPIDTGEFKGGVAFDVELLENAKWDNGQPITAEDYVFTIKAINLPSTNAGKYRDFTQHISNIELDPNNSKKFRVIFAKDHISALEIAVNIEIYPKYFYDSLNILDNYKYREFNEHNAEKLNADSTLLKFAATFNSNKYSREKMSGNGPYKFVSWTADQNVVLEKKQNYWAKGSNNALLQQNPDKIIFHIIPDEVTAVTQLKSGQIDVINEISSEQYHQLENDATIKDKFSFYHPGLIKQYYILLNNIDPKLKDVKVRTALSYLIDVDNILKNLESGMGTRSIGPIHPLKKTFNKDITPIPYDIEKAKNLLADAGWKDANGNGVLEKPIGGKSEELELEILISGQELGKRIAILLQENAAKAGIKIKITEKDFKLIRTEHVKTRNFQLVPTVISQDLIAWDDLSRWHSENITANGSNEMSYKNPEMDQLIDQIIVTKDETQRINLYKKMQELLYKDQSVIFLYAPEERIVISKNWTSFASVKRPGYFANTFKYVGAPVNHK